MKSNQIRVEERLQYMKGKTFLYKTFPTTLLTYNFDGGYCTIATDRQWITRPVDEMLRVLDDFLPCEEDDEAIPAQVQQELIVTPKVDMVSRFNELADIVLENIKMVQQDKTYVEQAQAVNNSVDMIIKLARTEIEAVRVIHEIMNRRQSLS